MSGPPAARARRPARRRATRLGALARILAAAAIPAALLLSATPAGAAPGDPPPAPATSGPNAPGGTGSSGAGAAAASPVRIDIVSVSPMTPDATALDQPVTITAVAVNTSGATFTGLRASLERGAAIVQPALLNDAVTTPPPTEQWPPRPQPQAQPGPLLPGGRATITFATTPEQMCLCYTGVFPYDLMLEGDSGSGYVEIGRSATFVPSFLDHPAQRTTVSWVWPLIDQPHRIGTSSVFLDDDLARSVSAQGRLDRALAVVERTAGSVPLALVVDPRLLDELATMTGGYTVRGPSGDAPGSGAGAAAAWLARLRAIAPSTELILTPYGDPDPDVAVATGVPLSTALPQAVDPQVRELLSDARRDIAWPDSGQVSSAALDALAGAGAATLLLSGDLLAESPVLPPTALAPASAGGSAVTAVALDPQVQQRVADAVGVGALREPGAPAAATSADTQTSAARIQALLAELALWPINDEDGFVALAPPRRVDADPVAASDAILATASQPWSRAEGLVAALADQPRQSRGAVEPAPRSPASGALISSINAARQATDTAASLLGDSAAASSLLLSVSDDLVEAASSAWRADPGRGVRFAELARAEAAAVTSGVAIVTPDNASYSLPSENSPLILTLHNDLPYEVQVRVAVATAPGSTAGFRADDVGVVTLPAEGTRTLHVPAHFERSGRFQIEAQLTTVGGSALSDPVRLNVLCTAIGGVALAVTAVAFGLLVCLLVFRAVRGLRRRRAGIGGPDGPDGPAGPSGGPRPNDDQEPAIS